MRSKRQGLQSLLVMISLCTLWAILPCLFQRHMHDPNVDDWKEVVRNEMDSTLSNVTWELTELPYCCKPAGCMWVFKRKLRPNGTIDKYKARLTAKSYT